MLRAADARTAGSGLICHAGASKLRPVGGEWKETDAHAPAPHCAIEGPQPMTRETPGRLAHFPSMRVPGRILGLAIALTALIGAAVACQDRESARQAAAAMERVESAQRSIEAARQREAVPAQSRGPP